MVVEFVMLLVWCTLPLVVYAGARGIIHWREAREPTHPAFDPVARLEYLRRRGTTRTVTARGRMSEAVRLAEAAAPGAPVHVQHH